MTTKSNGYIIGGMRKWFWGYFKFRAGVTIFLVLTFLFSFTIWVVFNLLGIRHEIVGWLSVLIGGGLAGYLVAGDKEPRKKGKTSFACMMLGHEYPYDVTPRICKRCGNIHDDDRQDEGEG